MRYVDLDEFASKKRQLAGMHPGVWTGSSGATRGLSDHLMDGGYKLCCLAEIIASEGFAITWVSPSWGWAIVGKLSGQKGPIVAFTPTPPLSGH